MLLQSDIARLVLGYLAEQNMTNTFNSFLNESAHVGALYELFSQGLSSPYLPTLTMFGKTLCIILDEYSCMKDTESQYLRSQKGQMGPARKVAQLWEQFEQAATTLRSFQVASSLDCHTHFRPFNGTSPENSHMKCLTPAQGWNKQKKVVRKIMKIGAPQIVEAIQNTDAQIKTPVVSSVLQAIDAESGNLSPAFRPQSTTLPSGAELNRRKKMRSAPKRLSDVERRDKEKHLQEPIVEDPASQLLRNVTNNEPEAIAVVGATILKQMKKCSNASKSSEVIINPSSGVSKEQQPSFDVNETRCNQQSIASMTIDSLLGSDFLGPENPEFMKDLETLLSLSSGMEEKSGETNATQHTANKSPEPAPPLPLTSQCEGNDTSMDLNIQPSPCNETGTARELPSPQHSSQPPPATAIQEVAPSPKVESDTKGMENMQTSYTPDEQRDVATKVNDDPLPAPPPEPMLVTHISTGVDVPMQAKAVDEKAPISMDHEVSRSDEETANAVRSLLNISNDNANSYDDVTMDDNNDVVVVSQQEAPKSVSIETVLSHTADTAEDNPALVPEDTGSSQGAVGGFFYLGQDATDRNKKSVPQNTAKNFGLQECQVSLSKSEIEKSGYLSLGESPAKIEQATPTKFYPRDVVTPVKKQLADLLDSPAKHTRSRKTVSESTQKNFDSNNVERHSRSSDKTTNTDSRRVSLSKSAEKTSAAGKMPKIKMKSARSRSRERKAEKLLAEKSKKQTTTKSRKSLGGIEQGVSRNPTNVQITPPKFKNKTQPEDQIESDTSSPTQTVLEAVCLQSKPTPVKTDTTTEEEEKLEEPESLFHDDDVDFPQNVYSSPRKLTLRYGLRAIESSSDELTNKTCPNVQENTVSDLLTAKSDHNGVSAAAPSGEKNEDTDSIVPKLTTSSSSVCSSLQSLQQNQETLPTKDPTLVSNHAILPSECSIANNCQIPPRKDVEAMDASSVSKVRVVGDDIESTSVCHKPNTVIYTSPTTYNTNVSKPNTGKLFTKTIAENGECSKDKVTAITATSAVPTKPIPTPATVSSKSLDTFNTGAKRSITVAKQNVIRLNKDEENLDLQTILDRLVKQTKSSDSQVSKPNAIPPIESSADEQVPDPAKAKFMPESISSHKTTEASKGISESQSPVEDGALLSNLCRQEVTGESLTLLLNETSLTQVISAAKELEENTKSPSNKTHSPPATASPPKQLTFSTISPTAGIFSVFGDENADPVPCSTESQSNSSLKQWLNTECTKPQQAQTLSIASQSVVSASNSLKKLLTPVGVQLEQERTPVAIGARRNLDFVAVQASPVFTPAQQHYEGTKKPRYRKLLPKSTPFPGMTGSGIDAFEIRQDISKPKFPQGAVRRSLEVRKTPTKIGTGVETAPTTVERSSAFYPVVSSVPPSTPPPPTNTELKSKPVVTHELASNPGSVRKSARLKKQRVKVNYKESDMEKEQSAQLFDAKVQNISRNEIKEVKVSKSPSVESKGTSPELRIPENRTPAPKEIFPPKQEAMSSTTSEVNKTHIPNVERKLAKSKKSKKKEKLKEGISSPKKEETNVVLQYIHKEEEKLSSPEESRLMILESFSDEEPQKKEKKKKRKKEKREKARGKKRKATPDDKEERRAAKKQRKLMKSLKTMSVVELTAILNQIHGKSDTNKIEPDPTKSKSPPSDATPHKNEFENIKDEDMAKNDNAQQIKESTSSEKDLNAAKTESKSNKFLSSANQTTSRPKKSLKNPQTKDFPQNSKRSLEKCRSFSLGDNSTPSWTVVHKDAPAYTKPPDTATEVQNSTTALSSPPYKNPTNSQDSILSPCSTEVSLATYEGSVSRRFKTHRSQHRKQKRRISLTQIPISPSKLGASPLHLRTPSPAVTCRDSPNTVNLVAESLIELSKSRDGVRDGTETGGNSHRVVTSRVDQHLQDGVNVEALPKPTPNENSKSPSRGARDVATPNTDCKKKKSKHKKRKTLSLDNLDITKFLSKIKYD